ncbi:hypothetical protein ACETRX_02940 [Labrys portucalensis]|uniref:DUF982 domain-containing protein n=1 Tax=Labrys neptuniae TaxID=376174 RepID=A0ABV6Z8R9_9HYPH
MNLNAQFKGNLQPSDTKKLAIYVPGATREELERGHQAAAAFFEENMCLPAQAAAAFFKLESIEFDPSVEMTDREIRIADVWQEAQEIAAKAICEGWREPAKFASFALGISTKKLAADCERNREMRGDTTLPHR